MLDDFEEAFSRFVEELNERCVALSNIQWTRRSSEQYDHKRVLEISVWYNGASMGNRTQEYGHIFQARSWEWNGQVDWPKVEAILVRHDWAIGPMEDTRVWNLAKLEEQTQPKARCVICGQLK